MISIIVPTYNEAENITELVSRIMKAMALGGVRDFEILIVDDDSPDKTEERALQLHKKEVRVIQRRGKKKGLALAVSDGFKEARGDILAVMDADLSHPPEVLPQMVKAMENAKLVVASRYVSGGGVENWPLSRQFASKLASAFAHLVTSVRDATSGYFMVHRSALEGLELRPKGFKIGLEVFVLANHQDKIHEVPYVFTDRKRGSSKLGAYVTICFFGQIFSLLMWKIFKKIR